MNIAEVYASLSATTLRKASGQNTSLWGPARHRGDLREVSRNLSTPSLSLYIIAYRAETRISEVKVKQQHLTHHQRFVREDTDMIPG